MIFRHLAAILFSFLLLATAAAAPIVHAHPALWHVKGPEGEVYLLGSIHLLPKNIEWRTGAISAAMARSTVFVFEVSTDEKAQAEIRKLVAEMGMLPPGQSLRETLPSSARDDYDAAIQIAAPSAGHRGP